MTIDQWALTILSVIAIYLATSKDRGVQRYGPIFGLCSQPFWLYTSYTHEQWGIFFLACVYTAMWIRGIYNFWWLSA